MSAGTDLGLRREDARIGFPWKIAAWFGSNNGWLRGRAPKDCLDEPKRIIEAAKHEIELICG